MRFLLGFVTALVVLAIGALILIYSGAFNIAASVPHGPVGAWVLETTMERSVKARAEAEGAVAPVTADGLLAGFREYDSECAQCHGAPGVERADWAEGMRPRPPDLARVATQWSAGELLWIVEHGFKLTGMPAMGAHHSDQDLRNVVAFVRTLPRVTAEDYQRMRATQTKPPPAADAPHSH